MRCEEALNQLNARSDGELQTDAVGDLDAHLAECESCQAAAQGLQAMDADLRRAFVSRRRAALRLAEHVSTAVRASAGVPASIAPVSVGVPITPRPRLAWGQALLAVAAGFLLAVGVFRPWQQRPMALNSSPPSEPVARLGVASGVVEVRPAFQATYFTCPSASPIERDSVVRTGPTARCEIALKDGNSVQLDCNTEVKLHDSEVVEVNRGRLWSCSRPGRKSFEIQSGGGTIVATGSAQLAVDCQPEGVRLIVVDGTANVRTGQESIDVGPGRKLRIVQGRLQEPPERCDALLETAWVNNVLALSSSEHPELVERVNQLLANVGAAKLSYLYEDELRRLGDGGVPPLLAYLTSTRDMPELAQRVTAAKIVADVAEARWIADLIELLTDANAEVRFHAARGLERLTGRDQGCNAKTWQSQPWTACEGAHQRWLDWWAANRDRYPAARRDVPRPNRLPFE